MRSILVYDHGEDPQGIKHLTRRHWTGGRGRTPEYIRTERIKVQKKLGARALFFSQFKSPIIIILIFAAILSFVLHDKTGATIILIIVFFSGILGFWQERGAANAVEKLIETVETKVEVLRDGKSSKIPLDEVVPGDIIELSAGKTIPGDCLILESNDLFINEAALSGETFPV
jgi:Mg2+-importing ATPase